MTDLGGVGHGAHCALHPDQQATRTCFRCGNFMCTTCSQDGAQPTCPTCRERVGEVQAFPLRRDNWSFNALWDYCFALFKQQWVMISVSVLIVGGIGFIANMLTQLLPLIGTLVDSQVLSVILTVVAFFVQTVVQGVLSMGMARMLLDVLQGRPASIERVFSQFHKAGTYVLTMLIILLVALVPVGAIAAIIVGAMSAMGEAGLVVAIGLGVLAVIPLIYFSLPLVLLQAEMAFRDEALPPMRLLRNCFAYARGERLSIFGVQFIGGLLAFAGVLACCVGVIPAFGLSSLLTTGLYLALSTGADIER
jgi:hypothetical protein